MRGTSSEAKASLTSSSAKRVDKNKKEEKKVDYLGQELNYEGEVGRIELHLEEKRFEDKMAEHE
jgi:hypothetical protein